MPDYPYWNRIEENPAAAPPVRGISGTGSPEGVITGDPGNTYLDISTEDFYVKKTGNGTTGWIKIIGT